MASSKALLFLLLVALTKANTAEQTLEDNFPFPLDELDDGEGGDENDLNADLGERDVDKEDEEGDEEDGYPLSNLEGLVPKDLANTILDRVQYKGIKKEEILEILKQKTRKNILKGIGNGSVSRLVKYLVYDCIKDITKIIKEEQEPKQVVNEDKIKKFTELGNTLISESLSKIKEVYKPLLDVLDNVSNPIINVTEKKQQIEEKLEQANSKITYTVTFSNNITKQSIELLAKERKVLDEYIKQFTDSVISSNCLEFRQSNLAFQKCMEDLYCEFALNVSKSVDLIEKVTKEIDLMVVVTTEYVGNQTEKIINETKEEVAKEIEKIKEMNNTNPEVAKKEYVQNKSTEVEKQIDEILKEKEKINDAVNKVKLTIETAIADVNATQKGLRETIRDYLNNTGAPNAIVDEYVQLKTSEIITKANKVIEVFNKIETRVGQLENEIKKIKEEYSTEIVYEKCKNSSKFVECVNSEFQKLNDKIKPLEDELKYHIIDHIPQLEKELKEVTIKVLTEASEYAQKESQRIIDEAIEKQKYVKDTKEKSDEKIKTQVDPLVKEITNIVDNLTSKYDEVPDDLEKKLIEIVKQNAEDPEAPITEGDKKLIQDSIDIVIKKIEEFKNQLAKEEDNGINLEVDLKTTASTVDQQYLRVQCANEWDWVTPYKSCIDVNIKPVNDKTDVVEKKLLEIIERLKQNNVTTDIDINKLIKEIINTVEVTTTMNRISRDENNATTSLERVNECLTSIWKRINEELRPLLDDLFTIPEDLSQSSNQDVNEAKVTINKAFQVWAETLDLYSFKNPNKSAVYKKEKASIQTLIEQSLKKINYTIQINIDKFVLLEKEIVELEESFYNKLNDFNFETLNATCAYVYSSKKNYSQCIDSECKKFNKYFDETANKLKNITDQANIDFLDAKNNITKTIEEEQAKAKEKDREETIKVLVENNVTVETIASFPLGELGRFNVTPYNISIYDIRIKALELQKRTIYMNTSGLDMLNRVPNSLKLHEYAASVICPKVSLKNYTDYIEQLTNEAKKKAISQFPNILPYVNDLLAYTYKLEAELKTEISKLQLTVVEENCGSKKNDLYEYYVCVKALVDAFEKYLVPNAKNAIALSQDAYNAVVNNTILLNKWRDDVVLKELEGLRNVLSPIPESLYNGTCNATKDKVMDFALLTINSRWGRLKGPLRDTEDKVSEAAKQVLSKNYTGIVNPVPNLNDSVRFIRDALAAAQKKNASYVTTELKAVPDSLVANGVSKFNKFVDDITKNASNALADAQASRNLSEAIYNSLNKPNLEAACYNPNATFPMTDFVTCNNNLSYGFEVEIQKLQNKLDETKKILDNINDSAGKKILEEYAKKLSQELLAVSAQRAINIYNDNKLPIPDELKPYVKNNCLASSTAGRVAGCIIEF